MNQLLEWSPLIVFFAVFQLLGIYWATGALMAVYTLVLLVHRARTGRFKPLHLLTGAVLLVLGTATLLFHDKRFIQWKPTVLLALTAAAFLGSSVLGRRPLARRMLESVFEEPLDLSAQAWMALNLAWVAWFALLAAANLYVAERFSEGTWVKFKVFGISAATIVFMIPQILWLHGRIKPAPAKGAAP